MFFKFKLSIKVNALLVHPIEATESTDNKVLNGKIDAMTNLMQHYFSKLFDETIGKILENQNDLKSQIDEQNEIFNSIKENITELLMDQDLKSIKTSNVIAEIFRTQEENFKKINENIKQISQNHQINSSILATLSSTKKDESKNYSLSTDIEIKELTNQGFDIVHDASNTQKTTNTDLYKIREICSKDSIICAGEAYRKQLKIVSCGNCLTILPQKATNEPILNNGAFWYFIPNKSFGFSTSYNDLFESSCNEFQCRFKSNHCKDYLQFCLSLDKFAHFHSFDRRNRKILFLKK